MTYPKKQTLSLQNWHFLSLAKSLCFSQFFENLSNGIDVSLAWVLDIDEDIIYINNDKIIKLFGQDLIDISLETGRCIKKSKRHYLVLKMAVLSPKDCFSFIVLFYTYLMVSTHEIELGKLFGLT